MAILLRNGVVFNHTPRTGGTWIRYILEELDILQCKLGNKHTIRWGEKNFSFVRNPLTWYQSWYGWKVAHPKGIAYPVELNPFWHLDINRFVENGSKYSPGTLGKRFQSLTQPPTNCVNYVGYFECLQSHLKKIFSLLEIDCGNLIEEVEPKSVTSHLHLPLSDKSIGILHESEKQAFDLFYSSSKQKENMKICVFAK